MTEIQNTKTKRHRQTDRQMQCFNDKQTNKHALHVDYKHNWDTQLLKHKQTHQQTHTNALFQW